MATSIKYTGFVSGLVPLENNPECTVTVSVISNKTELSLSKSTGISANNISLGQYRNSFTIPLKQIVSNYNNSVLNYFYEGDLLDWNLSSIEITKTDYFGNELAIDVSLYTLPYTISNSDIGKLGGLLFYFVNNSGSSLLMSIPGDVSQFFYIVEPEYIDILTKVNNAGQNISFEPYVVNKQNTLIRTLKTAGIWDKLDVLYIFGLGGNATDSSYNYFRTINWKNPNLYQATLVNSFTIFSNGIRPVSCSSFSYIDTNFVPSINGVNYSLNNSSRFIGRNFPSTGAIDGTSSSNNNNLTASLTNQQRINSTNNLSSVYNPGNATYSSINRLSNTSVRLSSSDTGFTSRTQTSTALPSESQLILRNGSSYGCHGISVYAMGVSLTDAEITAFQTAISTYYTSL